MELNLTWMSHSWRISRYWTLLSSFCLLLELNYSWLQGDLSIKHKWSSMSIGGHHGITFKNRVSPSLNKDLAWDINIWPGHVEYQWWFNGTTSHPVCFEWEKRTATIYFLEGDFNWVNDVPSSQIGNYPWVTGEQCSKPLVVDVLQGVIPTNLRNYI